jgi:D-tyrosyl-tRNA(Tyr) deacylase
MKAVLQRVKKASVTVDNQIISLIGPGLLTLLGVEKGDTAAATQELITKILNLRIFEDQNGKMNLSLKDIQGEHLIVSQFTLAADCSKGRRPTFTAAEEPKQAKALYELALKFSTEQGVLTKGGQFQAHMEVELLNDGPVTILL